MKIGLMGFEFSSPNKGCEALSYSFLNILNKLAKTKEITVYNFTRYELGDVSNIFKNLKIVKKNISFRNIGVKYLKNFKECDMIFDITMGDSFSDIYSLKFYKKLIIEKLIALKCCKNYILLPQTYGPFYKQSSFYLAKPIIKRASYIFCRDEKSQKLLEEKMNVKNTILSSDIAFMLPYDKEKYNMSKKEKIGLNVSGLLYKGGFNKENQFDLKVNYPDLIRLLIDKLSQKYELHLISHVIDKSENANDDDFKICRDLQKEYPNTILGPAFTNPIDAKSYISNMDIFIGSRMHSTIASFSTNVVTIPISYSIKFEGLFGSLNYPYVVNAKKDNTETAFNNVMKYIEEKETLKRCQEKSMKVIEKRNNHFEKMISEIILEE